MARTRGATGVIHLDDGELLDKEGKPIDPIARHDIHREVDQAIAELEQLAKDQGTPLPEMPPPTPVAARYHIDASTCQRDMDGWELVRVLEILMGTPLEANLSAEEFGALPADVKRHFRRVA